MAVSLRALADNENEDSFGDDQDEGMTMIDSAIAELGVLAIQSSDPSFKPGAQDIVISEFDAANAMAFIDELNLEMLALKEDEARTYLLPEAEVPGLFGIQPGGFQVFVADVNARQDNRAWSKKFLRSLGAATQEMFKNVAVRLKSGTTEATHSLIMAGRAKDLGLAKKAFADAMTLAGFDIGWRGYVRCNPSSSAAIEEKLASYGFSLEGTTLVFKAISEIPEEHRGEAAKVVLATLAEDLSSLNRVISNAREEMQQRKEYAKVKRIKELHDITDEALYYLLTKLQNTSKLDPKGDILPLLQENRDFMALAEERVQLFGKAIEVTINEAMRSGLTQDEVLDVITRQGLTLKTAGVPPLKLFTDQAPGQQQKQDGGGKIRELRAAQP
jgi:hypothetical protein